MAALRPTGERGPEVAFRWLDTLWVQVAGTLCNIACRHCFISCGPKAVEVPLMTFDQVNGAWTVTAIHLTTRARVPKVDAAKFAEIAANAKANCPIPRVLNATITMDAKLVS